MARIAWLTGMVVMISLAPASCSFEVIGLGSMQYADGEERSEDAAAGDGVQLDADAWTDGRGDDAADGLRPGHCLNPEDCAPEFACLVPRCEEGLCEYQADDAACGESTPCVTRKCTLETGCASEVHKGAACPPEETCFASGACDADGQCQPDEPLACEQIPCHENVCSPASGQCEPEPISGGDCNDANECTSNDTCVDGTCTGTLVPGKCSCQTNTDCDKYQDGDKCNGILKCKDKLCQVDPETIIQCLKDPALPCMDNQCVPQTGKCQPMPVAKNVTCDDGNPCTFPTLCDGEGKCAGPSVADGTSCDLDANKCTQDQCAKGACQAGAQKPCEPGDDCVIVECQPASGACKPFPLSGVPCEYGPCSVGDECVEGECKEGWYSCYECEKPEYAGLGCEDENPATLTSFCWNGKCRGFSASPWTEPGNATGFLRVSSVQADFFALGLKSSGSAGALKIDYKFVKVNPGLPPKPDWGYAGIEAPAEMDGRAAVGPPASIYFLGGGWTGGNPLADAVKLACPEIGADGTPSAVAYREDNSGPAASPVPLETVAVGFRHANPDEKNCFLAMCSRVSNAATWSCKGIKKSDVAGWLPDADALPAVTAIRLPPPATSCLTPATGCYNPDAPIYYAFNEVTPEGEAATMNLHAGHYDGVKFKADVLYSDSVPVESGLERRVTALTVDSGGNFAAVGTFGFVWARPAGKDTGFIVSSAFQMLEGDETHFYGVYHDDSISLLAANRLRQTADDEGNKQLEVIAGVVTGPAKLLLAPEYGDEPFFGQLASFNACDGCYSGNGGPWGLTDLALNRDHVLIDPKLPVIIDPAIMLSATVLDSASGNAFATTYFVGP